MSCSITRASQFDDADPALLAQASQLVSCEFHEIVKASGWTVTEWRIMATLAGGRALSTGELSRVSLTKQPTVTRVLHGMQERGEVERIDDASDRVTVEGRIDYVWADNRDNGEPLPRSHGAPLRAVASGSIS